MKKKIINMTLIFTVLLLLMSGTASAEGIRSYGEGQDNFHKDQFSIILDSNGDGNVGENHGISQVDSSGYYNGWVDPENEDNNFQVKYKLTFSAEDKKRISKGDVSVKVSMYTRDTTSGLNDEARFNLIVIKNDGSEVTIDSKWAESGGATWTFNKNIPTDSSALVLYFHSEDNGNNEVEFNNINVYFYDNGQPDIKEIKTSSSGAMSIGNNIYVQAVFNEAVKVTGTPKIKMNTGGYAYYTSGNGTDTLTFRYIVSEGEKTQVGQYLNYNTNPASIELNGGTIKDFAGNNALLSFISKTNNLYNKITVDGIRPQISSIDTNIDNKILKSEDTLNFTIMFTKPVNVTGSASDIKIALNNGSYAYCQSTGNNITQLNFVYTVAKTDTDVETLDVKSTNEFIGGTIKDTLGNELVNRDLKSISSKNIRIDNTPPSINIINNGNTTYAKNHSTQVIITDDGGIADCFKYYWSNSNSQSLDWNNINNTSTSGDYIGIDEGYTGDYYLYIRAEDKVGNVAYVVSNVFKLDNQGPNVTVDTNGNSSPSDDCSVRVQIEDIYVDINLDSIRYKWVSDNGKSTAWKEWNDSDGSCIISALDSDVDSHGKWKLVIEAQDSLTNPSSYETGYFLIDMVGPEISISPADSETDNEYNRAYTVGVTAVDRNIYNGTDYNNGTIKGIWYQWSDSEDQPVKWLNYYGSFDAGIDENFNKTKYLHVKVEDNSGNITYAKQIFTFDNTEPSITFIPNGSEMVQKYASTNINVDDIDNAIGSVYYQWCSKAQEDDLETDTKWLLNIGNGENILVDNNKWNETNIYNDYNIQLHDADGDWYLVVKAADEAGNEAIRVSNRFRLDNLPPEGYIDIEESCINTNKVNITLHASDSYSNPNEIQYRISIDGGESWSEWKTLVSKLIDYPIVDEEGYRTVMVQYKDKFNNETDIKKEGFTDTVYLDKIEPTGNVVYSCESWTNENVTASLIDLMDNHTESNNIFVVNNEGKTEYTFIQNSTFDFIISDEAGNQKPITAEVNCIDKIPPTIKLTTTGSSTPSQTVATNVYAEDNVTTLDEILMYYQWSLSDDVNSLDENKWNTMNNNQKVELKDVDGNWYLHVMAEDNVGNISKFTSNKYVLDNTEPIPTIEYSSTSRTANPVKATITFNEIATILNPRDGTNFHVFTEEGYHDFEFKYVDIAGNIGSKIVAVDWIDKSLPSVDVLYSQTDWTNKNVTVSMSVYGDPKRELINFNFEDGLDVELLSSQIESDQTVTVAVYNIKENGIFNFTVRDCETGITDTVNISINNIDKVLPHGEISYSTLEKTQDNITVTIEATDNVNQEVLVIPPTEALISEINGCKYYTFTQNGEYEFTLRDAAGNENIITATIDNIDRESPTGTIEYNPAGWCNGEVVATLIPNEEVTVLNNNGNTSYKFYENGSFTFELVDTAGNTGMVTSVVDWIDKESPQGSIVYSTTDRTNQDVEVTIISSDNSGEDIEVIYPNEALVIEKDGQTIYSFGQNGSYDFILKDLAGNESTIVANIYNIDKVMPYAEVTYSTKDPTNKDVEVTLTLSEDAEIISPYEAEIEEKNGSTKYIFSENGSYEFTLTDEAKNTNKVIVVIENIDRANPVATVTYSTLEQTSKPVIVNVYANEEFKVANNFNSKEKVFYENGEYTFVIQDLAGNTSQVTAKVSNIDRTPPKVNIIYNTTSYTNQNVIAELVSDEEFVVLNNDGNSNYTFKQNGTFKFKVADLLGNQTDVYATVDCIDKVSPTILFDTDYTPVFIQNSEYILNDYSAFDNIDGDITDNVNIDYNSFDISIPNEYLVTYSVADCAGNITTINRDVTVISKDAFRAFINGRDINSGKIIVDNPVINFKILNNKGNISIKWKKGKLIKGEVKSRPNILEGNVFEARSTGWYTFYIQDQERNTQVVQVFVSSIIK